MTWDHPPWRLFDEDMFIDDLVAGRATHCSKLLVNAILAYGCVSIVDASRHSRKLTRLVAKLRSDRPSQRSSGIILLRRSKTIVAS